MQFYQYADSWALFKKSQLHHQLNINTRQEMYQWVHAQSPDALSARHAIFDQLWHQANCPYYDVYPSIIPLLTKITLDIPGHTITDTYLNEHHSQQIINQAQSTQNIQQLNTHLINYITQHAHLANLLIRLPQQNNPLTFKHNNQTHTVKTIYLSYQPVNTAITGTAKNIQLTHGLVIGIDIGETIKGILPSHTMKVFPLTNNTIEHSLNILPPHKSVTQGIPVPETLIHQCIKLCLTLRLIENDKDLIQPDVLTKDRTRYETANQQLKDQLIQKAQRRGKNGYLIGHKLNTTNSPHLRKPHPALVWTGQGRKIPKIIFRKGSIIHKQKIQQIPTGTLK